VLDNSTTGPDRVFAYDLLTGDRLEDAEFELDARNRFSHGLWSDGETVWIADSGQDKLFAYRLRDGARLPDRDLDLDERNRDPRGIWSDGTLMYVVDSVKDALFVYDLSTGALLAEYELDSLNRSPRGVWSDGVTIWISDDGAKRVFAYRIEDGQLKRLEEEEFGFRSLLKAGNGGAGRGERCDCTGRRRRRRREWAPGHVVGGRADQRHCDVAGRQPGARVSRDDRNRKPGAASDGAAVAATEGRRRLGPHRSGYVLQRPRWRPTELHARSVFGSEHCRSDCCQWRSERHADCPRQDEFRRIGQRWLAQQ